MSPDRLEAKVEALFRRYRRDAVLLHRPYPPHEGPRTNSKFGGLPRLPGHYEWPRTSRGSPLHFLAQVDCADIPFASPLPDRGVLFFFGRDDEEQVWDVDGPASDDCRVVHVLDAFAATPPRPAPAYLPPIGGGYSRPAWREYLLEGEKGPAVHVEWPIRPLRMDSWLDPAALADDLESAQSGWRGILGSLTGWTEDDYADLVERYEEVLVERTIAGLAAATGTEPGPAPGSSGREIEIAAALVLDGGGGPGPWPDRWIHVHYFARAALRRPGSVTGQERAGEILAGGSSWLARSLDRPFYEEIEAGDRRAFQQWVASIRHPEDKRPLSSGAARLVIAAAAAAIRAWAGDPSLAALIPTPVYSALTGEFGTASVWGLQYSQMLGHAPSAQEPLPADDPTVCLLNLASEQGMGWMFGDVGNATFWIAPRDLARRDFGKVRATIEGH